MKANPKRRAITNENYRDRVERPLGDWLGRSLDAITRSDVEDRFNRITEKRGWATANQCMSLLRSVYRRPCVDHGGLAIPSISGSQAAAGSYVRLVVSLGSLELGYAAAIGYLTELVKVDRDLDLEVTELLQRSARVVEDLT